VTHTGSRAAATGWPRTGGAPWHAPKHAPWPGRAPIAPRGPGTWQLAQAIDGAPVIVTLPSWRV
jgi:hypothetical protein